MSNFLIKPKSDVPNLLATGCW